MLRINHRLVGLFTALFTAILITAPLLIPLPTPAAAQPRVAISSEFRLALEPYGEFRSHPRWGDVWIPANVGRDWRPYTVGHWVYSDDYGWYWVSDDSEAQWGWITFHYGRWVHDRNLDWVWIPGNQWGPAFVDWRRGRNHIGWAPMPPDEIIVEVRDDPIYWDFVPAREFLAPRLVSVIVPVRESEIFVRETVIENRTVFVRERNFAVNPGISPAIVAAAVGQPVHTFQVRPVVLAGTANIAGATTVRADQLRTNRTSVVRQATAVQQTNNTIQPARNVPPPQPLARGENGRLGDNPPRAARGVAGTTGAASAPTSPPAAQSTRPSEQRGPNAAPSSQSPAAQTPPRTPSATTGQGAPQPSTQPNLGNERRGQGVQQRERGGVQNLPRTPSGTTGQAPSTQPSVGSERRGPGAQQRERGGPQASPTPQPPAPRGPGQRSGTTGAAPSAPSLNREPRREAPALQNRRGPSERITPQAAPREHAAPPSAARPSPQPQAPAARAPTPERAPAARGPEPRPSAPTAQAPRTAPSTTGAGPRGGGGPHEERR
jgi:hypothetical protein